MVHLPVETEIVACRREIISGVVFDSKRTFVSGEIVLPKVVALLGKSRMLFGQKESFSPLTGAVFLRQASCAIIAWAVYLMTQQCACLDPPETQEYLGGGRQDDQSTPRSPQELGAGHVIGTGRGRDRVKIRQKSARQTFSDLFFRTLVLENVRRDALCRIVPTYCITFKTEHK